MAPKEQKRTSLRVLGGSSFFPPEVLALMLFVITSAHPGVNRFAALEGSQPEGQRFAFDERPKRMACAKPE